MGGTNFTETNDVPLLAQAFYRIQLSDNISVQPGLFSIANLGGDSDNDSVWIGSLRTKFSF
ncbi:MAG: carbohydrate porin [Synechococcales cyanobacterium RU_4_20]|nr:carbohydrate porin [Synechococcales cyanobacterium RU_4_20]NJR68266.1 carbohydrate porin [Synechococcales cyanobacterium CRU_2_2]